MRDRGAIAQLGERLDRTQEVGGSSPPSSMGERLDRTQEVGGSSPPSSIANLQVFFEGGREAAFVLQPICNPRTHASGANHSKRTDSDELLRGGA